MRIITLKTVIYLLYITLFLIIGGHINSIYAQTSIRRLAWPVSSPDSEHAPTLTLNGKVMIFMSNRDGGRGSYDLYETRFSNGRWSTPQNLRILNTQYWEGYPRLSPDGSELYFSTNRHRKDARAGNIDIWHSKRSRAGKWQQPQPLKGFNSKGADAFVSLTPDGNNAYFSSSRRGGKGGLDIWYARKTPQRRWQVVKPVSEVNSSAHETSPALLMTGDRLFFSSNRSGSRGFDIYYARRPQREAPFRNIERVGNWLNTGDNEMFFSVGVNRENIHLSRGRKDEENIFEVAVKNRFKFNRVLYLYGNVVDALSGKPVENAAINFQIPNRTSIHRNGYIPPARSTVTSDRKTGAYRFFPIYSQKYIISVDHKGYRSYRQLLKLNNRPFKESEYLNIYLKSGQNELNYQVVYFDKGSTELSEKMQVALDRQIDYAESVPDKKIHLYGYSFVEEKTGRRDKNLGFMRAEAVRQYMISEGVLPSRIRIVSQQMMGIKGKYYPEEQLRSFKSVEIKLK